MRPLLAILCIIKLSKGEPELMHDFCHSYYTVSLLELSYNMQLSLV